MKAKILLWLAVGLCFGPLPAYVQEPAPKPQSPSPEEDTSSIVVSGKVGLAFDAFIRTRMPQFSGTVLVYEKGNLALAKGYGLADKEKKIPITRSSIYDIYSTSKQFTSAAILKLEMEGKCKTSDTLGQHFAQVPANKKNITLHQLMTHTSGMHRQAQGLKGAQPMTYAEFRDMALALPVKGKPGTFFTYSNTGYVLLACLVEKIANVPFERYLKEALFKPAGMTRTGISEDFELSRDTSVHAYSAVGADLGLVIAEPSRYPKGRGPAGVVTCADDLLKWHLALQGDKVLSAEAKEKYFKPIANSGTYGCGIMVGQINGNPMLFHGGTGLGFTGVFTRFPKDNTVVIMLANTGKPPVFQQAMIPLLFRTIENKIPPEAAKVLPVYTVPEKLEGTYLFGQTGAVYSKGLFVKGKREGEFISFYKDSGKVWTKQMFKAGKPASALKAFYENGTLKSENMFMATGTGFFKAYYPSGQLKIEVPYKNFHRDGLEKRYNNAGECTFTVKHNVDGTHQVMPALVGEQP